MEDKKIEKAESDLKKAEADLKVAEAAETAAEEEVKEAIEELKEAEDHEHEVHFEIQIDRKKYRVDLPQMTGLQLRALPTPPIGPDRDLFETVPGGTDRKIGDAEVVKMKNGLRFFSAPAQITPGIEEGSGPSV